LQRYFTARGVEEFSLDVAMEWVDEACGFFAKEQAGALKQTDVYLFASKRIARVSCGFTSCGCSASRRVLSVPRGLPGS
jgi:hypothetical protein